MSVDMVSGNVTIAGGTYTVSGNNTLIYAAQVAAAVTALIAKKDTITTLHPSTPGATHPPAGATPIYELAASTVAGAQVYAVPAAGYLIDTLAGANTINGTAKAGDSVFANGTGIATDFIANGGKNLVVFCDGNNQYNAAKGDTGGDTVVAGTGLDTINTGGGLTTVNSGTGDATIYLNDTVTTTGFNDRAWLDDGHSMVFANGVSDGVIVNVEAQTITGGANAQNLAVVLAPNNDSLAAGDNLVNAGGTAVVAVYDETDANTINAGSGILYVVDAESVTGPVFNGAGTAYVFGNVGVNTSIFTTSGDIGGVVFIAGTGNETLNGAAATSSLYMYGGNDSVAGADLLVGGAGNDVLVAGQGSDTLMGGAGTNTFLLDSTASAGATITIADFTASATNRIDLSGFGSLDAENLVSGGSVSGGNYTVELSNAALVTFVGVTSGAELNGHLVVF